MLQEVNTPISTADMLISFHFLLFFPQDQHLHNFFQYCQKTESGAQALGNELVKYLKVLGGFLINPF